MVSDTVYGRREEWKEDDTPTSFKGLFRESIVDGLRFVLGEGGKEVILKNYGLDQRVLDAGQIDHVLTTVFKDIGAPILERAILKELFLKLNERLPDSKPLNFVSCVDLARNRYEHKG